MSGKRGNGEGSIYRRSDGRWCAAVKPGNGPRRVLYGKTRLEVAKKLAAAQRQIEKGVLPIGDRLTVAVFLQQWLENAAKPSLRERTFRGYHDIARLHILPELGRIPLGKLTAQQVLALQNKLLRSGLSASTVLNVRRVLGKALGQAVMWSLIMRNPVRLVEAPRVRREEIRPLTPEQARLLLDHVRGDRLEALYTVGMALGLRLGEALGLKREDIDLEERTLKVQRALQRAGKTLVFVEPKTRHSRRTIALPGVALDALRAHRVRQVEERLRMGPRWQETGVVFTSSIGTPLEPRNVTRWFQEHVQRAGLPHQRFHDLRHACASFLLAQGVSPRVVMETLGHTQISTTLDIYSHVLPSLQRDAADRMDQLLVARS